MVDAILGTKSHMGQVFTTSGRRLAVSVVKTGPNIVTQVKAEEKDGYRAVQIGLLAKRIKRLKKPQLGHLQGAGKKAPHFLREVRLDEDQQYKVGDILEPGRTLKPGDVVSVMGVSKGKGFAGVVKRWGFAGGPKTHGQSDRLRAPGSIGQGTRPGRVWKGKKMAGRMGSKRTTVKGLIVLGVKDDELYLSGPVPGSRGSLLVIKKVGENKKFEGFSTREEAASLKQQEEQAEGTEVGELGTKEEENAGEKVDK